jgi:hypothetical protein
MLLRLDPAQLDGSPPSAATWDILRTTVNVPCVSGSLNGQPRIRPRNATLSAIHEVVSQRGVLQMPPIASQLVDTPDVAIVASWIQSLPTDAGVAIPDGGIPDAGHLGHDGGLADAEAGAVSMESGAPEAGTPESGAEFDDATVDGTTEDATVSGDDGGDDASD